MKKILIILSILITIIISNKQNKVIIPKDSIRIRIIANSNNLNDQLTKLNIKSKIEDKLYKDIESKKNINEARNFIKDNLNDIEDILKNETDNYNINYGYNYFPKKEYKGVIYEAGEYESLVINLGEGLGNNWWCVLFPPLCMLDIEKNNDIKIEYKSKVLEILNRYN